MNKVELWLCRHFLPRLIAKSCAGRIPRYGKFSEPVFNCFCVYIDRQGEPYLLARSMANDFLDCLMWEDRGDGRGTLSYCIDTKIPLTAVDPASILVTHEYGSSQVRYSGIFEVAIGRTFFFQYFKIHAVGILSSVVQLFFNKKKLVTKQRIDLLHTMLEQRLEGTLMINTTQLMDKLYSVNWMSHPDGDLQFKKLEFYLESLSQTGELVKKVNRGWIQYQLTGHALRAIEEYEEQERKHTEHVKVQRGIFWLTIVVAIFTAAQAGLFKVPTLIDLSSSKYITIPSGGSPSKPSQFKP
jgi:hypothetical protein